MHVRHYGTCTAEVGYRSMTRVRTVRPYNTFVDVDAERVKEIIRKADTLNGVQISRCIGHRDTWVSNMMRRGRASTMDIKSIKLRTGIDLSPAIVEKANDPEEIPAKEEATPIEEKPFSWAKTIDEYSYVRSNDIDRLVRSIDRLTEMLEAVLR